MGKMQYCSRGSIMFFQLCYVPYIHLDAIEFRILAARNSVQHLSIPPDQKRNTPTKWQTNSS